MIRPTLVVIVTLIAGAITAPVYAHSQKAAITRVLFNPRTANLEVMHRFSMHDAEHAVKQIFDGDADIISSKDTQEKFSKYVADRFSIMESDGKALVLESVGYEIEGKFFWVYQETKAPEAETLILSHNALRDLWPTQINTVNIEGKHGLRTVTFDGSEELITVNLKPND